VGTALAAPALEYLAMAPRANTSEHGDITTYYGATLNELVRRKDALIIDRFNYSGPDQADSIATR